MTNTIEQIIEATPNLAGLIQDNSSSREEVLAEYEAIIRLAREGMVPTPSFPREVWGIQRGTWPPEKYQSEQNARWHLDQLSQGSDEYHLVKGTAYSIDWEVVK